LINRITGGLLGAGDAAEGWRRILRGLGVAIGFAFANRTLTFLVSFGSLVSGAATAVGALGRAVIFLSRNLVGLGARILVPLGIAITAAKALQAALAQANVDLDLGVLDNIGDVSLDGTIAGEALNDIIDLVNGVGAAIDDRLTGGSIDNSLQGWMTEAAEA
ncbi:MAG: hypothetical protein AAFP86_21185, partial [Planctomycetota bacterium]